jgi:hypothetical protein
LFSRGPETPLAYLCREKAHGRYFTLDFVGRIDGHGHPQDVSFTVAADLIDFVETSFSEESDSDGVRGMLSPTDMRSDKIRHDADVWFCAPLGTESPSEGVPDDFERFRHDYGTEESNVQDDVDVQSQCEVAE